MSQKVKLSARYPQHALQWRRFPNHGPGEPALISADMLELGKLQGDRTRDVKVVDS